MRMSTSVVLFVLLYLLT